MMHRPAAVHTLLLLAIGVSAAAATSTGTGTYVEQAPLAAGDSEAPPAAPSPSISRCDRPRRAAHCPAPRAFSAAATRPSPVDARAVPHVTVAAASDRRPSMPSPPQVRCRPSPPPPPSLPAPLPGIKREHVQRHVDHRPSRARRPGESVALRRVPGNQYQAGLLFRTSINTCCCSLRRCARWGRSRR